MFGKHGVVFNGYIFVWFCRISIDSRVLNEQVLSSLDMASALPRVRI
jgi:hypothetical protein